MKQMYKSVRLTPRWGDFLAACIVLVCAAALIVYCGMGTHERAAAVQIWQDGVYQGEYQLIQDQEIAVDGRYRNTIRIQNGRAAIVNSTCPGQDCIKSGWHERARQSIVCLPNRLELRLVGGSRDPDIDIVIR